MENVQIIQENVLERIPLILQLNAGGEPLGWINYEKSAYFYAKNKVLWSLGQHEVKLRGGTNAKTGERSTLMINTIVAVDSKHSPTKYRNGVPPLTNRTLFIRDMNICGYCGNHFHNSQLTRDHVTPTSKGGKNIWENVVSACKRCNHRKSDNTPEQARMPLIYVPYVPNYNEHLILQNRRILFDQMEFLMKGVSKNSRVKEMYKEMFG